VGTVLAIDPGRRHGKTLDRLTRELHGHEIIVATSGDEALAVFESVIPELVLFPLFLAPADEARIQSRLRALPSPADLQALTIPFHAFFDWEGHATRPTAVPPRWYYWFRPRDGADFDLRDPWQFAETVRVQIDRPRIAAKPPALETPRHRVEPPPAEVPIVLPTPIAPRPAPVAPQVVEPPSAPVSVVAAVHEAKPDPEPVPVAWRSAALSTEEIRSEYRADRDDDPVFPAASSDERPRRAASAWMAASKGAMGAVGRTFSSIAGLTDVIGPAGRAMTEQAGRVPRSVWVAATVVIIIATLGVTGRISRLVMAPVSWVTAAKSGWFPEQPKTGVAEIQTIPDGAQVWLNGRQLGVTPFKTEFAVGSHEVELRYRGSSRMVTLDVTPGSSVVQRIEWAAPKAFGKLRIESDPAGATVVIDGQAVGVTPMTTEDLPVGRHSVDLTTGGNSVHEIVEVKAARITTLQTSVYQGWLALFSPIEVRVAVDGRPLALDDQNRVLLAAGSHELTIQSRTLGYQDTRTVAIAPGKTTAVSVVVPKTSLSVSASGPAEVWIDGTRVGEAPIVDLPVDIGTREVLVRSAEHGERRLTVTATVAPVRVAVDFSASTT
jgi:PEGA domain